MKTKTLILLGILISLAFTSHKYYLSLTQITHVAEKNSVQIVMQVFLDDVELALNKTYQIDALLTTDKEVTDIDTYFVRYLKENFNISINNQEVSHQYIGKEYEGDLVFFYLEISDIQQVKNIVISNHLLFSYFPKQQHLIKVGAHEKHQSLLLTKGNDKGLLKF